MTQIGLHPGRQTATARVAFNQCHGWDPQREADRAAQIAALPNVHWKWRTLYTLRCHGTRGKGSHDTNVPESLLWSLIDLRAYRCPYHEGD